MLVDIHAIKSYVDIHVHVHVISMDIVEYFIMGTENANIVIVKLFMALSVRYMFALSQYKSIL